MVYHTYLMGSASGVLYLGVTNDLERRVIEHKTKVNVGFSSRYNTVKLVYFEAFGDVREAIAREKQLKGWSREKKKKLIRETNPMWRNLLEDLKAGTVEIKEEKKSSEKKAGGTDPSTSSG